MTKNVPIEVLLEYRWLCNELDYHSYWYYEKDDPKTSDYDWDMKFRKVTRIEESYPELVHPNSPTQKVGFKIVE